MNARDDPAYKEMSEIYRRVAMGEQILYTVQFRERLRVPLRWHIWCIVGYEDVAVNYAVDVAADHPEFETRVVASGGQIVYPKTESDAQA